jgi:hypothetical protein
LPAGDFLVAIFGISISIRGFKMAKVAGAFRAFRAASILQNVLRGFAATLLVLGLASTASAQQSTGSIRGTVEGSTSGVEVEVVDVARGIARSQSPESNGTFRFDGLAVGQYEVSVRSGGSIVDSQMVTVRLGETTGVTMATTSEMIEEIITTGRRMRAIDTSIAESGLVIGADEIVKLPVQRDLTAVAMLAPGATLGDYRFEATGGGRNNLSGIISFSGSSIAENTSFINGLNTTNFRTGVGFSQVPFEFYETFQIKTGGYSAKYGRSTGGVMNARTKSGSNDWTFGANAYFETQTDTSPATYLADNNLDDAEDTTMDLYVGGPILKDRLFFYALYSDKTTDEFYAQSQAQRAYGYDVDESFWGVKLDAYITDNHHLEYTAFSDERTGVEGTYGYDPATQQQGTYLGDTNYREGGDNWIATYTGNFGDDITLSVSYGENEAGRTTSPSSADNPTIYEADAAGNLNARGEWTAFLVDEGSDKREMTRVDLNWLLGSHDISLGIDNEEMFAENATVNSGGVYWLLDPLNSYFGCDPTDCPSGGTARQRTYNNGGYFESSSKAYYIQDVWDINEYWTVEAGLRNESFENLNGEGGVFVKIDDQWAPRLAVVWDPKGDGSSKVFANYGLYYLPIAANTNIRMAGGETYIHDFYDWGGDQNADLTPTNLGAQYDQDVFGNGTVPDTRSTTDENIDPMYQSEFILGYQYFLDSGIELGVKGIYRNLETTIEDVAIDAAVIDYYNSTGSWDASLVGGDTVEDVFGGFHQYVLTNPGNDMRVYIPEQGEYIDLTAAQLRYPEAKRQYGAIELTFNRPYDGDWGIGGSYTWSHSWGNHEGYVNSDVAQDDAGITINFDQPGLVEGSYGDLPNDRRHTLKLWGQYQLTDHLLVSGNFLFQSGRPVSCRGVHPTDVFAQAYGADSFYCDGQLVKRGSVDRTPDLTNVNVGAQYDMQLGNNFNVLFSLDVFNLFNTQNATIYNEFAETGSSYPAPADADYLRIRQYQRPRFLRLSARIAFE